jgi:hypothetical protein
VARVFHLTGTSGAGKSTLGRELVRRGRSVIETDFAPGVASWVDIETALAVVPAPPFSDEWLERHEWRWDRPCLERLIDQAAADVVFLAGGAYNIAEFADMFAGVFLVYVADDQVLTARLQTREPERWPDGSPELERMLVWNRTVLDWHPGAHVLDGTLPVEELADEVERIAGL